MQKTEKIDKMSYVIAAAKLWISLIFLSTSRGGILKPERSGRRLSSHLFTVVPDIVYNISHYEYISADKKPAHKDYYRRQGTVYKRILC